MPKDLKLYEWDVEIFAAGKWNGLSFTVDDLHEIADNFKKLKDFHKVPLKLGHNDQQYITDGLPAIGWVKDVWVSKGADGKDKLFAKFEKVPEIVYKAARQKLYRKVSIELDFDVKHKNIYYKYVLSGIALLGADLPAVSTLADLDNYIQLSKNGDSGDYYEFSKHFGTLEYTKRLSFSMYDKQDEVNKMNIEELKVELEKAKNDLETAKIKLSKANTEKEKLEAEKAIIEAEKNKLKAEKAEFERKEKMKRVDNARKKINDIFENAVKDGRITPAKRDMFSKLLKVDDDDRVLDVDIEIVEKMISDETSVEFKKQSGKKGSDMSDRVYDDPGQELTRIAQEIMDKNDKLDFSRAFERAQQINPDLAREYLVDEKSYNVK